MALKEIERKCAMANWISRFLLFSIDHIVLSKIAIKKKVQQKCVQVKWHALINGIILEEEKTMLSKDLDMRMCVLGKGPSAF